MVKDFKDFFRNKNILITGHTGFKGSWLLLILLKLKANVWGFSLEPDAEPNLFRSLDQEIKGQYKHILGDIRDLGSLKKVVSESQPEIVFHLAAQPLVRKSYAEPNITWSTNLIGTLNLLEALKKLQNKCAVVLITTDKVYKNKGWIYGYRENDELGGNDPYSASKAASEILINSWRKSFCGNNGNEKSEFLKIASARAGNVIGGGDWAEDRLIPDIVRSIIQKENLIIRNGTSTRPWQHVIEPLYGYLILSLKLFQEKSNYFQSSFNFGPYLQSNKTVNQLVYEVNKSWQIEVIKEEKVDNLHEEEILNLDISKSLKDLDWSPKWDFSESVKKTIQWYKDVNQGDKIINRCYRDIDEYFD